MTPRPALELANSVCARCYIRLARGQLRPFTTSRTSSANSRQDDLVEKLKARTLGIDVPAVGEVVKTEGPTSTLSAKLQEIRARGEAQIANNELSYMEAEKSHHIHVHSTKHNTHITLTRPDRSPLLSLSAGNIGFKKANRGTYDAAYQLSAYTMGKMQEKGFLQKMEELEVVLRGYGPGREAFTKALLGTEGKFVKGYVRRVTDATRLKQGGTRARKVRRLG